MSETAPNPAVVALVKAAMEMPNPGKDSENGAYKHGGKAYRYASLNAFLDVIKPVLAKHGLALFQPVSTNVAAGTIECQTMFMHVSGTQVTFPPLAMPLHPSAKAQDAGSSISYMRRYSLQSALGLAADDDDAETDRQVRAEAKATTASRPAPSEPATARRADHVVAKPAEGKRAPGTAADLVGTVTYVKSEPGEKNGKPYVKTRIGLKPQDGGETLWVTSFSETVAETATAVNKTGKVMRAMMGGKSGDLVVDLFEDAPAHVPTTEVFDEQEVPF